MSDAAPTDVTPFPIRVLTGALTLTVGMLLALGWAAYDSSRNFTAMELHDLRLAELRGIIVHFDEVLTMSARMAATTGDQKWERRYRAFETKLDDAVKETMKLTTQSASADAAKQTDVANLKLVEMENQGFALVRAGQTAEARNVLFSEAYETQKKIYAAGMATMIDDIKAGLEITQRNMWRRTFFFVASALLAATLLIFTWVTVLRRLRQWQAALAHAVEALRRGTEELQVEVGERKRSEAGLRQSEAQLAAAQIIARIGSWEWAVAANQLTWSEENYRLHGFEPHEFAVTYESALEFVHPEERLSTDTAIRCAVRDGQSFSFQQRVVWRDGTARVIHQRGAVVLHPDGRVAKLVGTAQDVTERVQAQEELEKVHQQLLQASRQAGMAEVATGVLHNVGNVLNSVNISATLVADHVRLTKSGNIAKLAALLHEHRADLAGFLTKDARGQVIPAYLGALAEALAGEQKTLIAELDHLRKNIEHIKDIVATQQSHAKTSGFTEMIPLVELVEDALRMNANLLARHDVELVRDFQIRPVISTDKHKIVQILVNLIRNANFACDETGRADKQITARIAGDGQRVQISVSDNGVGIPIGNLTRIFGHGFTTRKHGHGFGLHSCELAAKEIGGSLTVQSDGPGRGATFTLDLPTNLLPALSAA